MYWKDRRVLITGLSGFVGSYLGEHLAQMGARVYGLVRRRADGETPRHIREHRLHDTAVLINGDLLDGVSLADALEVSHPDVVFHLAAQSFVPRSFQYPAETYVTNVIGTLNLLEAIRLKQLTPRFVFAGSSEEYGLVFHSQEAYSAALRRFGSVLPEPATMPELPIKESNPLRPVSPYGVSKAQGDLMVRNYALAYGLPAVVSRAFNHEGAGRGGVFVTSEITSQVARLTRDKAATSLTIGNVNAFRDWSHVNDIVRGYCILAEKGTPGDIYNQGSSRTNSVLSYMLLALNEVGIRVECITSFKNGKTVTDPLESDPTSIWGQTFEKTRLDAEMLKGSVSFDLEDEGLWLHTDKLKISVRFDQAKFRRIEVPILIADTTKIKELGFDIKHSVADIARDQISYSLSPDHSGPRG